MQVAESCNSLLLPCFIVPKDNIAYTVAHIKIYFVAIINKKQYIYGSVYMHYTSMDILLEINYTFL